MNLNTVSTNYHVLNNVHFRGIYLQESEYLDGRQHCITIQTGNGEHHYWSLESRQELLGFEKSWYRANYLAVKHLGVSTVYH